MQSLNEMIAFLSAPLSKKIEVLSCLPNHGYYAINGSISDPMRPAHIVLVACLRIIRHNSHVIVDDELHRRFQEIDSLIDMAVTIGEDVIDYHFSLEKKGSVPCGPIDGVWDVILRLASDPVFGERIVFKDIFQLIKLADIEFIGISLTNDCNGYSLDSDSFTLSDYAVIFGQNRIDRVIMSDYCLDFHDLDAGRAPLEAFEKSIISFDTPCGRYHEYSWSVINNYTCFLRDIPKFFLFLPICSDVNQTEFLLIISDCAGKKWLFTNYSPIMECILLMGGNLDGVLTKENADSFIPKTCIDVQALDRYVKI